MHHTAGIVCMDIAYALQLPVRKSYCQLEHLISADLAWPGCVWRMVKGRHCNNKRWLPVFVMFSVVQEAADGGLRRFD